MPELPDIAVYLEALAPRVLQQPLERLRLGNPFIVRTIEPPVSALEGLARDRPSTPGQANLYS